MSVIPAHLRTRFAKVKALHDRPGTAGERAAAGAALGRVRVQMYREADKEKVMQWVRSGWKRSRRGNEYRSDWPFHVVVFAVQADRAGYRALVSNNSTGNTFPLPAKGQRPYKTSPAAKLAAFFTIEEMVDWA